MLGVAREEGVIDKVPKIKWASEEQTRFRYLDDQEERALLAYWKGHGDQDMYDLCVLLIDTGARCYSEMMAAHWEFYGQDFVSVTFWHTKTGKPRTIPLTKRSREILRRRKGIYGNHSGPFTMVNKNTMRHRWDHMRSVLGFHDVTPHTLRHTCCTRLILGGADVKRVMTWMGHLSIATTMRYMQIRPDDLNSLIGLLEAA